jgi:hypothetical protein
MENTLPAYSLAARSLTVGSLYEHYKGHRYKILAIGRHSESLEEVVVYQDLGGVHDVWVRPLTMFLEEILIGDKMRARFSKI